METAMTTCACGAIFAYESWSPSVVKARLENFWEAHRGHHVQSVSVGNVSVTTLESSETPLEAAESASTEEDGGPVPLEANPALLSPDQRSYGSERTIMDTLEQARQSAERLPKSLREAVRNSSGRSS